MSLSPLTDCVSPAYEKRADVTQAVHPLALMWSSECQPIAHSLTLQQAQQKGNGGAQFVYWTQQPVSDKAAVHDSLPSRCDSRAAYENLCSSCGSYSVPAEHKAEDNQTNVSLTTPGGGSGREQRDLRSKTHNPQEEFKQDTRNLGTVLFWNFLKLQQPGQPFWMLRDDSSKNLVVLYGQVLVEILEMLVESPPGW